MPELPEVEVTKRALEPHIVDEIIKKIIIRNHRLRWPINYCLLKKLENKKAYLYQVLNEYGFTEWNDLVDLIDAQPGKQVFSKTHRLLKDRKYLILTTINEDLVAKKPFIILFIY